MNQFELEIRNKNSERMKNIRDNFLSKGESDVLSKEEFEEFQKSNEVYSPSAVASYTNDLKKGLEDKTISQEDYDACISDLKVLKPVRVFNEGNSPIVFFAKSIEQSNDLEKGEEDVDTVEKGEGKEGEEKEIIKGEVGDEPEDDEEEEED